MVVASTSLGITVMTITCQSEYLIAKLYTSLHRAQRCANGMSLDDFTFFDSWIPQEEADHYLGRCLSEIPWAKKKWSLFYTLPQLAYYYGEKERKETPCPVVEDFIYRVETTFNTTASVVWCNLFNDGNHHIEWHQDQYGEHCWVLSFGASRVLEFRDLKTKKTLSSYNCKHGDLYYFCPQWDKVHEHRIPMDTNCKEQRVSFVIFTQPPYSGRYLSS